MSKKEFDVGSLISELQNTEVKNNKEFLENNNQDIIERLEDLTTISNVVDNDKTNTINNAIDMVKDLFKIFSTANSTKDLTKQLNDDLSSTIEAIKINKDNLKKDKANLKEKQELIRRIREKIEKTPNMELQLFIIQLEEYVHELNSPLLIRSKEDEYKDNMEGLLYCKVKINEFIPIAREREIWKDIPLKMERLISKIDSTEFTKASKVIDMVNKIVPELKWMETGINPQKFSKSIIEEYDDINEYIEEKTEKIKNYKETIEILKLKRKELEKELVKQNEETVELINSYFKK